MVATDRICPICHKFFSSNSNFTIHVNRKKPCVDPKLEEGVVLRPKKFKCSRCELLFENSQKLNLHMNRLNPCKIKQIDQQDLVEKLQLENEKLQLQVKQLEQKQLYQTNNTLSNHNSNNTTNNITNNIHIHAYGNENLSHITDDMYKECFSNPHKSVERLFNMIHFSKKQPSNHNLYISNVDTGHITILKNHRWEKNSQVVVFETKYYNMKEILITAFDIMRTSVPKTITSKLEKYFSPFVDNYIEEDFENQIKQASCDVMKYMAYNNRQIPMKMQKRMENT